MGIQTQANVVVRATVARVGSRGLRWRGTYGFAAAGRRKSGLWDAMRPLGRKPQWSVQALVRLLRLVVSTSYDSAVHTPSEPLTH